MENLYSNRTRFFALPVLNRYLAHAPLARTSALLNGPALRELASCLSDEPCSHVPEVASLASQLRERDEPLASDGHRPLDPLFLGLIPSRRCSMACMYCDFGAAEAPVQVMPPEICTAAVDFLFERALESGQRHCQVQFFGGEPFFDNNIVQIAIDRARLLAARTGIRLGTEASTNGFYSASMARFVRDHIDLAVVSLDGLRESHDRNRPSRAGGKTFDAVCNTLKILGESGITLEIRCCVTEQSVAQMPEAARWFSTAFRPSAVVFETLIENEKTARAGLRAPDPVEFARQFVLCSRILQGHGVRPVYAAALCDGPRMTFCPVGQDALICEPDGTLNACYLQRQAWERRGLHLGLGRIDASGRVSLDADSIARVRGLILDKPRCEACFCRYSCAGGCHVDNTWPGCSNEKNAFCHQTRIITACALLDAMGQAALVHQVVNDPGAMRAIALHPNDRLEDLAQALA